MKKALLILAAILAAAAARAVLSSGEAVPFATRAGNVDGGAGSSVWMQGTFLDLNGDQYPPAPLILTNSADFAPASVTNYILPANLDALAPLSGITTNITSTNGLNYYFNNGLLTAVTSSVPKPPPSFGTLYIGWYGSSGGEGFIWVTDSGGGDYYWHGFGDSPDTATYWSIGPFGTDPVPTITLDGSNLILSGAGNAEINGTYAPVTATTGDYGWKIVIP